MTKAVSHLAQVLGYQFRDEPLLTRALTHRSATRDNNERLEFLGDAILSFLIAEALYHQFPDATEGELTRFRAKLVRRETLAALSRNLDLGDFLNLGPGELKSGGRDRDSILADAFEALVGALFVDSDLGTCRERVLMAFADRLQHAPELASEKDPKTLLQELLQGRKLALPEYAVTEIEGAAHEHTFTVECRIAGVSQVTVGCGSNRRSAEQEAARKALQLLQRETESSG